MFLSCDPNRIVPCITFSFFITSNLSISSDLFFYFYFSTMSACLLHFVIDVILFTTSCGPSGPSVHLLMFPCTGGRSDLVQFCCFFFWGQLFCLMMALFEPIYLFLVSWMWPGLFCIFLLDLSHVQDWSTILYRRRSVHTQIWYRVLILQCMCNFGI